MECGCQVLDELAEVHTLVGNIVKNGLLTVTLIFYVANLHLQPQILGNLTAFNHRCMFQTLRLLEFVDVGLARYAIDAADVVSTLQVRLLQLHVHQSSCQRHHTDVVTRVRLYGHDVTLLQRQIVHIVVIALACMLELYLHQIRCVGIPWHVGQPVVGIQLTILTSDGIFT